MKHKNTRKIGYDAVASALKVITSNPYFIAASLAFQGFSMLESMDAGDDAAEAQRKAAELQRRQNEAEAAKQRIQIEREARIRRSNVLTAGAATGVSDSSSVEASIGSINTAAVENISTVNTKLGFATAIGQAQSDYYQAAADASFWKSISGVPGMLTSAAGMFKTPEAPSTPAPNFAPIKPSSWQAPNPFSSIG